MLVKTITGGKMNIHTNVQEMPYWQKGLDVRIGDSLGTFFFPLILSFLLPVFLYMIVLEKTGKLREMMKLVRIE